MARLRASSLLLLLALSCTPAAGTAPGARTAAAPDGTAAAPEKSPDETFALLKADLAKVPKAGPLMETLPPELQTATRELLQRLSPDEMKTLRDVNGPAPKSHPLLHLLAGGNSPEAQLDVATHGRFTAELMQLAHANDLPSLQKLLPVARNISRRAAVLWLDGVRARSEQPDDVSAELADSMSRVALVLDRRELTLHASELAAKKDPTGEHWLRVVTARARLLDEGGARAALERAKKEKPPAKNATALFASAVKLVEAVPRARRGADAKDAATANDAARAYLDLALTDDAAKALAPYRAKAAADISLAATIARTSTSSLAEKSCPQTESTTPLSQACLQMLLSQPELGQTTALLRKAWASGKGRTPESAEVYIGLAHILPFVTAMAGAGALDSDEAFRRIAEGASQLESALAEAMTINPDLGGLHFYAVALKLVFSKKDKGNLWTNPAERADFEARAVDIAKRYGKHRLGQAGVLFAAAMLALDGNSEALVDALPADVDPSLRATRALIKLWPAVVERRKDAAAAAVNELLQVLPPEDEDALRRGKLALLLLETDFALSENASAMSSLDDAAQKLMVPGWPPDVRLRAVIDHAAVLARSGNRAAAVELLDAIPEEEAKQADDYERIAKGYSLVLQAQGARGKDKKALRDRLAKVGGDDAPRAFRLWRDMWVKELDFTLAMDRCGKNEACVKRAAKTRRPTDQEMDAAAGRWLATLAKHGVLSNGTFQAGLGYSTVSGLAATVDFSFAFPAVEYPLN